MASGAGNSNSTLVEYYWKESLLAFEILNVTEMVLTTWVLLSLIVYGTKTRRWRKTPGSSSLNSGMIYTTCTIAVALFIPRLVVVQILFSSENSVETDWCQVICIIGNVTSAVSTYASYFFLWLLQRVVYNHPYVKQRLSKWSTWVSYATVVVLTAVAVTLGAFYVAGGEYEGAPYGCRYKETNQTGISWETTGKNLILAVALLIAQLLVLCLSVYPVVRVKFDSSQNLQDGEKGGLSQHPEKSSRPNCCTQFFMQIFGADGPRSPIEMTARRAMICSIIMVVSDVVSLVPAAIAFPFNAPVPLRDGVFNIGSFLNIFCMIATFGFAGRILTLFVPSCPKHRRGKSYTDNGDGSDQVRGDN